MHRSYYRWSSSLRGSWLCIFVIVAAACGGQGVQNDRDAASTADGTLDAAGPDAALPQDAGPDAEVPEGCEAVQAGVNTGFMVDGLARSFILTLPNDIATGGPFPVVFNWHGLGDTAANMNQLLSGSVNMAGFHFILVTPEDSSFSLYGQSVDWEVFVVNADTNREVRLFDEVLTCLRSKYAVDDDRIHSVGFSLGSIVTDMLGTVRGDQLASLVTYSGAYFSNPDNVATLGMLSGSVSWPAPTHSNGYAQLFLHGGVNDTYSLQVVVIHFDVFAANDAQYLNGLGHDVVICDHGQGHTAPVPGMTAVQALEFLKDHPRGVVSSPYATGGLPTDFASYCDFQPKTN